jgi:hypothetical protein
LGKGQIQKAYQGILSFMSALRTTLEKRYPDHAVSTLYLGYMDMTYFAFTPADLKQKRLKIAIVYLHEGGTFEVWLGGSNRTVQAEVIEQVSLMPLDDHLRLSRVQPGVDSILEATLVQQPDFDHPEDLMQELEEKTVEFISHIRPLLETVSVR